MRITRIVAALIAAPSLLCAGLVATGAPVSAAPQTDTFTSDGTFVVPAGVTSIDVELVGGSGGTCDNGGAGITPGGLGAVVTTTLAVTPGSTIQVRIGGQGTCTIPSGAGVGGANGGGDGGDAQGGGGGGATDLRVGSALTDRIAVAGGGGGGSWVFMTGFAGGAGGTPDGADAQAIAYPAQGGTQSAGGAPGGVTGWFGNPGALGVGGSGYGFRGGGGGGGYYGGGGGSTSVYQGGGGGGSSWVDVSLGTGTSYSVAGSPGAGSATITYDVPPPTTTTTTTPSLAPTNVPAGVTPDAGFGAARADSLTAATGGSIGLIGSGWQPTSSVTVSVHSDPVTLGTSTTSAGGVLFAVFTLPPSIPPGAHEVVLTGVGADGQPATVTLALTVAASTGSGPTGTPLSFTG